MNLSPGTTVGVYQVIEPLGRGGMGAVYKVYHPQLKVQRAIKVVLPVFNDEAEFQARFQKEAQAIARMRHPNILPVHDFGEEQGFAYLVTDLVDGGTLADRAGGPLPVDRVVKLLGPIASALDYAHSRGVIHRDVKPSNILLYSDETPVLADFGIAKDLEATVVGGQTTRPVGTPTYMAPEQVDGKPASPATDQYALAAVAYELLTGQVPFTGPTPESVLVAHLVKPLPPPRSINPALSKAVEKVLIKGLAKGPEDRYSSVSAFVDALAGAAGSSSPDSSGRRVTAFAVIGVVALILVIGGALLLRGGLGLSPALGASATSLGTAPRSAAATGPSPTARAAIKLNQAVTGSFKTHDDQDNYSFVANANDTVLLSVKETGGRPGFTPEARIFGPDGTIICPATSSAESPRRCTLRNPGNYVVNVHPRPLSEAEGSYTLQLAPAR